MLYGEMPVHNEETQFIIKKCALRTRPEIDAIAVIIKYPQPNLEYVLRWNLPENDYREFELGHDDKRKSKNLTELLWLAEHKNKVDKFYHDLTDYIESEIFKDNRFSSFLLAYKHNDKYLEVSRCDKKYLPRIAGKIIIGRGPAGKAFKMRKAVFWEKGCGLFAEYGLPDYPVEEVIKDLRPIKVFAMPLIFPTYISQEGEVGDEEHYICPAWGCLSLVSEEENSFKRLSGITISDKERELGLIFRSVNKKVSESIKELFPEVF